jgi:polycomb protein EED
LAKVIICRSKLDSNGTIEILRWFEDEENTTEHAAPDDKVRVYAHRSAWP